MLSEQQLTGSVEVSNGPQSAGQQSNGSVEISNGSQRAELQTCLMTRGYHYSLVGANPILRSFVGVVDLNLPNVLPKITVSGRFLNPNNAPIHSTVVSVDCRRFLVVEYFDIQVPENLNIQEIFPHLPWHGELAIFSLGKRVRLLSRPSGGRYVKGKAVGIYIRAVVEMRLAGYEAPFQVAYSSTFTL